MLTLPLVTVHISRMNALDASLENVETFNSDTGVQALVFLCYFLRSVAHLLFISSSNLVSKHVSFATSRETKQRLFGFGCKTYTII